MTNLRAIDSATIGEHAIALTLALARGFDKFVVDTEAGSVAPRERRAHADARRQDDAGCGARWHRH